MIHVSRHLSVQLCLIMGELCLAYISRLKPTKVVVWQYNNKRQTLRYRVHYATKVFDARNCTTKVLVHSDPSSSVNQSAIIVDCNGHGRRARHKSYARLLSWSGQQHTNVLASLRLAYITQLLGVTKSANHPTFGRKSANVR